MHTVTASVILKQKIHINSYFLWFCAVQVRQKELGISSYGVSVTTLEEVFIKVGDHASSLLSKNGEKETSIVDESSEDSANHSANYGSTASRLKRRWRGMQYQAVPGDDDAPGLAEVILFSSCSQTLGDDCFLVVSFGHMPQSTALWNSSVVFSLPLQQACMRGT